MITFEDACAIAQKFYEDSLFIHGIHSPYDIGDAWVFNGGREGVRTIGIQKIAVSKTDGEVKPFNLPSKENFALLENGIALTLPKDIC